MEVVSASKMCVNLYQTTHCNPGDGHFKLSFPVLLYFDATLWTKSLYRPKWEGTNSFSCQQMAVEFIFVHMNNHEEVKLELPPMLD